MMYEYVGVISHLRCKQEVIEVLIESLQALHRAYKRAAEMLQNHILDYFTKVLMMITLLILLATASSVICELNWVSSYSYFMLGLSVD